jgi:hypothetical protein
VFLNGSFIKSISGEGEEELEEGSKGKLGDEDEDEDEGEGIEEPGEDENGLES